MTPGIRWIDRSAVDVPFYMGAALVGWAMLLAHVLGGVSALALYWVWILFLDGPHLWATLSRTYLDREERLTRRSLLRGAFAWALLPLAALGWGFATGQRLPWFLFLVFVQVWAYWHVVRQHYGFLVLYQRKGGEPAGTENRLDYAAFYVVMLAPFVSFALRHPTARHDLGLPAQLGGFERGCNALLLALTAAAVLAYLLKTVQRWRSGAGGNVAKNLFLAACVPLHLCALLHPTWSTSMDILVLSVVVTSFHNIQYNALVWSYGRRRYQGDGEGARYGVAARVFKSPWAWYLFGIGLTVALRYATWKFDGRFWPFAPTSRALPGPFAAAEYVNAVWWIVAMHHYYLDQKIWRLSRDARVRADLGLEAA